MRALAIALTLRASTACCGHGGRAVVLVVCALAAPAVAVWMSRLW